MQINALLGYFPFAIETAMFQQLDRTTAQRWSQHERVGRRAAQQNLGPGDDDLTIPGYIMPCHTGQLSAYSVDILREMMREAKPYTLIKLSANGFIGDLRGQWIILDVQETQAEFFGASPQRIDFTLRLRRVNEDNSKLSEVISAIL